MGSKEVETVQRKRSTKTNVDFASPISLHESGDGRKVLVPFFIRRSNGAEFACKIDDYRRERSGSHSSERLHSSISLSEAAARRLLKTLKQHLAVAETDEEGDYLLIRASSEETDGQGGQDPKRVAEALSKILHQPDIVSHLATLDLGQELVEALRGAIRLRELQSAVDRLHTLLSDGVTADQEYQEWCTAHGWAFGNVYIGPDDVRRISSGDQLDLLLPTVLGGYRDIVELKRPDMEVLKWDSSHKNFYFSSEVGKAIGQCHRYLDVFHEEAGKGLRDHAEIVAYHPRATLVIGRSIGWEEQKTRALHGLNRRLNGISIMTFDHLLAQGRRLLAVFKSTESEGQSQQTDHSFVDFDDDDIHF